MKKLLLACLATLSLTACNVENAEYNQRQATIQLQAEADRQIGMPDIVNFQERRLAKQILEMRDKEIITHTYIKSDLKGCLVYLGQSIGYGLPYSVQFTNPEKYSRNGSNIPQADPNGLYMPDSLSATWVLLYDNDTKETKPVYVEPAITVSPFRIKKAEC